MSDDLADTADPLRAALIRSVFIISPLSEVAAAISVATEHERRFYVERMVRGWRWSFTAPGGGYPLLRISARFLQMNHTKLLIGFRTIDGYAVLCKNPRSPSKPQAWAFVDFDGPTDPAGVEERLVQTFAVDRGAA